jgi:uncharacterized membrane protein
METRLRVGVPVDLAHALWSNPAEFPNFMGGVVSVSEKPKGVFQLEAESSGGRERWSIELTEKSPHCIRWTNRGKGRFLGEVLLRSTGDGSEVWLSVDYEPRSAHDDGASDRTLHTWDVGGDMLRFKIYAEGVLEESLVGAPV